jgi:hypothetical protein
LSERHVPLDELFSVERFESRAVRRLAAPASHGVAVTGPSGGGKSSFVAWVSSSLPESHVALRLPVSALSDPTDTGETLKMSLGVVLDTIEMEAVEREAVHIERAEQRAAARAPTGITGGRIGGGPIPAEVNLEVGSLRQEFVENKLDGDYLSGVNRVVAILASKGVIPVFVFEDTEAIVGPADAEPTRVDGFFEGPSACSSRRSTPRASSPSRRVSPRHRPPTRGSRHRWRSWTSRTSAARRGRRLRGYSNAGSR